MDVAESHYSSRWQGVGIIYVFAVIFFTYPAGEKVKLGEKTHFDSSEDRRPEQVG